MRGLWETRQGRSSQRNQALEGLVTPYAYVAGSGLARAPVLGGYASQNTNAEDTHIGKAVGPFYGPDGDPCVLK